MGSDAGGKGGGGRGGYRRDYNARPDRGGFMDRSGASGAAAENGAAWSSYNGNGVANGNGVQKAENSVVSANGNGVAHTNVVANGCPQAALADLEKKVADIHQDFSQSLHKVGEKENEKFDLIFAILTELQHRQ
ncbi:unnamed protein product, partial [Polarella glacialis]